MKLKIALLVRSFPATSESFILTQVAYLLDAGHDVRIFATHKVSSHQPYHKLVTDYNLMNRVTYRPELPDSLLKRLFQAASLVFGNLPALGKNLQALNFFRFGRLAASFDLLFTAQPFLQPHDFDLVHCHYGPIGVRAAALKAIGLLPHKMMVTFHGYDVMKKEIAERKGYYNLMISSADLFTVNSAYTKKRAVSIGIPAEKIRKLPMGLDTDKFVSKRAFAKSADGVVRFISVGRLVEVKGYEFAIRAFAQVVHSLGITYVHFSIVGNGELFDRLTALIKELGLEPHVALLGSKSQEELKELFQSSDVFILSGIHAANGAAEAQGLVIQEAQAMGLPVIVSEVGGMPEGMVDGETGLLVPEKDVQALADKIIYLARNEAERKKMGLSGREFTVRKFDYRVLGRQLEDCYQELLRS